MARVGGHARFKAPFRCWFVFEIWDVSLILILLDVIETVRKFTDHFSPEHVRVCFLSPDQAGVEHRVKYRPLIDNLWQIDGVECMILDARSNTKNAFIYADFFDFS